MQSSDGRFSIRAESAGSGQGARFTFTLPVAEEAGAAAAAKSRPGVRAQQKGLERTHILVVDDDRQTLRYVRDALLAADYRPVVTADPEELPELVRAEKPALVLLDLMLPGPDGIELMQTVPELADLPVIFISAYGRDETVARALAAGAADYVVEPFSPTELTARVGAALRRLADPEPFVLGDLIIDYERRRVTVAGRAVRLTATEFELLRVFSLNAGRAVTSESLLRQIWGERNGDETDPVRSFARKLRNKLGDSSRHPRLHLQRARRRLPHAPPGRGVRACAPGGAPPGGPAERDRLTHCSEGGWRVALSVHDGTPGVPVSCNSKGSAGNVSGNAFPCPFPSMTTAGRVVLS